MIESTVPGIGQILIGKKKPSRKLLTNVAKMAAIETVKTTCRAELPFGRARAARPSGNPNHGGRRRSKRTELHE